MSYRHHIVHQMAHAIHNAIDQWRMLTFQICYTFHHSRCATADCRVHQQYIQRGIQLNWNWFLALVEFQQIAKCANSIIQTGWGAMHNAFGTKSPRRYFVEHCIPLFAHQLLEMNEVVAVPA